MSSTALHEAWDSHQQTIPFPGLYGSDGEEGDDRMLSLRAAYAKFLLPHLRNKSAAHRTKFRTALDHWERLIGPDMTIGQMDGNDLALLDFQSRLLEAKEPGKKGKKIGPGTVNSYVDTYIGAILRTCGRRDSRNKRGRNLIRDVPFVDALEFVPPRPVNATLAQLDRLYAAAAVAQWPDSRVLPPPLWWRVLFVLSFSYGPRTEDLAPIKRKGDGLTWQTVHTAPRCPFEELELEHSLGWIVFTPGKTRAKKGELILPQTAVVKRHLDALPKAASPGALLLPCKTHYEDFLDQRKAIEKAAGLEGRSITLQTVRRSCQSYWDKVSLAHGRPKKEGEGSTLLGDYITGHSARGVSARFYREPLLLLVEPDDRGEKLIDRFRYPEAMLKGP